MEITKIEKSVATGCLGLSGSRIDIVDMIGSRTQILPTAGEEEQFLFDCEAWFKELKALLPKENSMAYHSIDDIHGALWRTPICDRTMVPKAQQSDQFGYRVLVGLELTPQNFAGDDVKWRLDMSY